MELKKIGDIYVAECDYANRHIPRAAGFFFYSSSYTDKKYAPAEYGLDKVWWTDDKIKAASLIQYAVDNETLNSIRRIHTNISLSVSGDSTFEVPAPDGLEYMPFQRAGVEFAQARDNVLIADQMGLGKTIQAIGTVNYMENVKRVLVICPATLKLNWKLEIEKWSVNGLPVYVINSTSDFPTGPGFYIMNYDILRKFYDELRSDKWDALIVDECHYIKNQKAIRSRQVYGGTKKDGITPLKATKKIFLTGTPIVNRPVELFPIINYLDPKTFGNFWMYAKRYCAAQRTPFGWDFSGASNLNELQQKLRASVMIRRLKEDVLTDLKPKIRQIIEIPRIKSSGAEQTFINKFNLENLFKSDTTADSSVFASIVDSLDEYDKQIFFEQISAIRRDTAIAKIPVVVEHITDSLESSDKIVVFAHHHEVVDGIYEKFGDSAVVLTGRNSIEEKQAAVERFQNDPTCKLFIGSITAAGVGITLTASSHVIFAELDWVPGNVSQAEDRCHRIGQVDSVLVQHLVLENSIDLLLAKTIIQKQSVIDNALNDVKDIQQINIPVVETVKKTPMAPTAIVKSKLEVIGESLTEEQRIAIHNGLRYLSMYDADHARELNDVGFNRYDTGIGTSLAKAPKLSIKQAALGYKILRKYRRQLPTDLYTKIYD